MSTVDTIFALVHDRLGQTLRGVFDRTREPGDIFSISATRSSLLDQLADETTDTPDVTFGLLLDIVGSVATLPGPAAPDEARQSVLTFLRGKLSVLDQHTDDIAALIASENPTSIHNAGRALFARIGEGFRRPGLSAAPEIADWLRLQPLIGDDAATVLPLATIVNAVQVNLENASQVPKGIVQGLHAYFFTTAGFPTIDGATVVAPIHLSGLVKAGSSDAPDLAGLRQLKDLFAKATAEHYIRDITRIIVESAYDAGRGLSQLRDEITPRLRALKDPPKQDTIVSKFLVWLRGFSSMAESASMRAVEVATQGVSQFQTNPLIAAAAGSFAGTVARKLAQDSFLRLVHTQLNAR